MPLMCKSLARVFIIAIISLTAHPLRAQDDAMRVEVSDFEDVLETVIPEFGVWREVALTSDLARVAWLNGDPALCLHAFAAGDTACSPLPDQFREGPWHRLTWLPTQEYILLVAGNSSERRSEELWLFDVQTAAITNLTPHELDTDGYFLYRVWPGPGVFYAAEFENVRQAYSWDSTVTLYQLDPGLGTLVPLRQLEGPLADFYTLVAAVSPDGQRMALVTSTWTVEGPSDSLWLLDLSTHALTEVATGQMLRVGQPADYGYNLPPSMLTWTADGAALIVKLEGVAAFEPIGALATYLDLDQGQAAPLLDLSHLEEDDLHKGWQGLPRDGQVTPDGRFFMYHALGQDGLQTWTLPTAPGARTPVAATGHFEYHCGRNYPLLTVHEGDMTRRYVVRLMVGCAE
jgi:hypothetical protein